MGGFGEFGGTELGGLGGGGEELGGGAPEEPGAEEGGEEATELGV